LGVSEMLRINGSAVITTREDLMQRFLHDGNRPRTVVVGARAKPVRPGGQRAPKSQNR
jgi:hypothetical protein